MTGALQGYRLRRERWSGGRVGSPSVPRARVTTGTRFDTEINCCNFISRCDQHHVNLCTVGLLFTAAVVYIIIRGFVVKIIANEVVGYNY